MMLKTNVTGLINMTQAILPIFKGRPDGGAGDIINVGSIAGKCSDRSNGTFFATNPGGDDNRPRTLRRRLNLLCDEGRGQEFLG